MRSYISICIATYTHKVFATKIYIHPGASLIYNSVSLSNVVMSREKYLLGLQKMNVRGYFL